MEPDFTSHPDDTRLEMYSMGKLGSDEAAAVEEHLLLCADCQVRLEEAETFIRTFRRVAPALETPRPRSAGWRLGAIAAALVLASGLAWWGAQRGPEPAPVAVTLTALRGDPAGVAAGRHLRLVLDLTGLPAEHAYAVEIVSREGRAIWSGTLAAGRTEIETGKPLAAGRYFVRVASPRGDPLREFALRAE